MKKVLVAAVAFLLFLSVPFFSTAQEKTSLGFGIGHPYGGFGANLEHHLIDHLAFTAGAGYVPDNLGWNVGCRGYFVSLKKKIRPRLTLLYGVNDVLDLKERSYDTFRGISVGLGIDHRYWKKWAWNIDVFWSDDTKAAENLINTGKADRMGHEVKGSLGVTYRF